METAKNHQRKIARLTLELSCAGARIMGGMEHTGAAEILGVAVPYCECFQNAPCDMCGAIGEKMRVSSSFYAVHFCDDRRACKRRADGKGNA